MSIELFSPGPRSRRSLQVGPLACELDGLAAWLATQGYARQTGEARVRLVRHLSLWLEREGLGVEALDEERFERFLRPRGARGKTNGGVVTGRELLAHLRCGGRSPDPPEETGSDDAITRIERTYEHFLVNERAAICSAVAPGEDLQRAQPPGAGRDAEQRLGARVTTRFSSRPWALMLAASSASACAIAGSLALPRTLASSWRSRRRGMRRVSGDPVVSGGVGLLIAFSVIQANSGLCEPRGGRAAAPSRPAKPPARAWP